MPLSIVILAAGRGRRMRSALPKVLHRLAGRPLVEHVYNSVLALSAHRIQIVHGRGDEGLIEALSHLDVDWVEQPEALGTGDAVRYALPMIPDSDQVLILCGDVPLITADTLARLIAVAGLDGFALLTAELDDPTGYGRIVRDAASGVLSRIVEERDAGADERAIREISTGTMVVNAARLKRYIEQLTCDNAQGEFYLTDAVELAIRRGETIATAVPESTTEILGVNNRLQLAEMERYFQLVQAHHLMRHGVTLLDPARFDLRGDLEIGSDCEIDVNVVLEGRLRLGDRVKIGAHCTIKNTLIDDDVEILPNTVIDDAVIGKRCCIGPFARIRPASVLHDGVRVGNFVEVKHATLEHGVKANHLSYLGDAEIGADSNVGAGVITCNYDGIAKHKTVIGADVFVGSDVQFIAPVSVSSGATIAAGSTITKNVGERELAISRTPQKNIPDWKRTGKK